MKRKLFLIILLLFVVVSKETITSSSKEVHVEANSYFVGTDELKVTSDNYLLENSYIKHVQPRTSEKDFLSSFTVTNATLGVTCSGANKNYVGTGCFLNLKDQAMNTVDYGIVVTGDVTGDGDTTITDVVKIASHSEKKINLENEFYLEAADLDQNNSISVEDSNSLAYYSICDMDIPVAGDTSSSETIALVSKMLVLSKGSSQKLLTKVQQEGTSVIEWKSSNEDVVVVDSTGLVTGVDSGNATITVKSSSGDDVAVEVNVIVVVSPTGIQLDVADSFQMNVGEEKTLSATISPSDATNKEITWTSNHSEIITVSDSGVIQAIAPGTATITATTVNGYTVSTEITVVQPVTGISLNMNSIDSVLGVDSSNYSLSATLSPANATNKSIVWSSTNANVATVDTNGQVSIKNVGTATIVATTANGLKAGCTITVTKPTLSLSSSSVSLKDEDTSKLSVTVTPSRADASVIWKSSDSNVVTVDSSGNLQAKSSGTAIITATSSKYSGISTSATVVVRPIQVLFVGNSKTYYPEGETAAKGIPLRFKQIAASAGYELEYTMAVKGGKTLSTVYELKESLITDSSYDYVILQEQNAAYINSSIATYREGVTIITDAVKANNKNVEIYLRKVWALTTSTTSEINRGYSNTLQLVTVLKNNYGITSKVINDGPAFYEIYNSGTYSDVVTLFSDDRHQTAAGAYLSGLCIYSTIFEKDPTSVTYAADLSTSVVNLLKKIAKSHCY